MSARVRRGWPRWLAGAPWTLFALFLSALSWGDAGRAPSPAPSEPGPRGAAPPAYASFAFIIGVNQGVDQENAVLRYADDDAARYLELFRALGARSYVLTRPDANTQKLHPQVAAEALLPMRADFERAAALLAADVEQARQRGVRTVLYFVYAGHGNVKNGHGYLALEDSRLDATELETQVLERIRPDQTHFIVDACYSYFLTLERGPGGARHEIHGFAELGGLAKKENVGLLLSTSSARESHEWSGVESGVFSHEVRSGLYGAADADGDGLVSYREIAAFIDRANGSITNNRFRPDVYAHPPKSTDVLLDLRGNARPRIEVPASLGGHYFVEDSRGVRVADLHNDHQAAYVVKPVNAGRLYVRRLADEVEFVVPPNATAVSLADLRPQEPHSNARGAANDAFDALFALPFNQRVVQSFALRSWSASPKDAPARAPLPEWRLYTGIGLLGAATASTIAASAAMISASDAGSSAGPDASPAAVADAHDKVRSRRQWATVGFGFAGAAAVAGLAVLLWPDSPAPPVDLTPSPHGASLQVRGRF